MEVDLTSFDVIGLVMYIPMSSWTCLIHLVWSCWMCINVFNEKCIFIECTFFLAWFQSMYAYGLILSTSGVLIPFHIFPQYFRFWSLKFFWIRLEEDLDIVIIQVGYVLTLRGRCHYLANGVVLSLRLLCFFLFHLVWNIV